MKRFSLLMFAILLSGFFLSRPAPAAGVSANLTTATPSSGAQGEPLSSVVIQGSSTTFDGTTTLSFGAGISVGSITVSSATSLTAHSVAIADDAAIGTRTVVATTGAQTASGEIFTVLPTWVIQTSESVSSYLYDVQALSEKIVYAVGDEDTFYKATDRGMTWTVSNISGDSNDHFHALSFVNANTGYAAGVDRGSFVPIIYKTMNGGSVWSDVSPTDHATPTIIYDLFFADANTGWAAARGSTSTTETKNLFRTTDGGSSWETISLYSGDQKPEMHGVSAVYNTSTGSYDVWAVGGWPGFFMGTPPFYILYKSTDSGATWTPGTIEAGWYYSKLQFVDTNTGYAIGDLYPGGSDATSGYIFKSTDGGSSWNSITPSPAPMELAALHFIDANKGWVAGNAGTILYTDDGGSSWTSYSGDLRSLYGVSYYNDCNAWAVGGNDLPKGATGDAGRVIMKHVVKPIINNLSPAEGRPGQTLDVILTGTNFQGDPLSFGSGITVNSFDVAGESSTTGTANITIAPDASPGPRDVTLTNPDSGVGTKTGAFSVQTTTTTTTTTTTVTTTTTTVPSTDPQIDSISNNIQLLASSGRSTSHILTGTNFASGATVKLVKAGQGEIAASNVLVSLDGKEISFSVQLPPRSDTGAIGYWNIVVTNPDASSTTLVNGFRVELPEGEIFFYPTELSFSALRASAAAGQARIAYTLSENKTVDIYIYDVREMRVIFHRKYASGQSGGALGYNEVLWDGRTDLGSTIANGSYVLQIVSGGTVIGKTYFVVKD